MRKTFFYLVKPILLGLALMLSPVAAAETIKIGVAGAFSGDLASYGVPVKNAVELAVRDINAKGGILGRQLEMVAEDDVCEPNTAANVANKLASEKVVAVIGHLCSGATKAALPVYKNANIIAVSAASTNPDLTLDGNNPNFFRTIAHDATQANLQVEFAVNKLKVKKAAVIHDKQDYGKGLAELVKAGLEKNDVEVVLFEGITPGAPDYAALISKLKEAGASRKGTAVFYGGYHPEASKIVTAARKKRNNAYFISGDGVKDPSFLNATGRYSLDYFVTAPVDTSSLPLAISFANSYRAAFGEEPGTFSLQGYAAVVAIADAIEKSGGTEYESLRQNLHSGHYATPIGDIYFDEKGDVIGAGFAVFQVLPDFQPVQ